jgi:hypothetical protein
MAHTQKKDDTGSLCHATMTRRVKDISDLYEQLGNNAK